MTLRCGDVRFRFPHKRRSTQAQIDKNLYSDVYYTFLLYKVASPRELTLRSENNLKEI